jgi:P-type E1-E2 ATPase
VLPTEGIAIDALLGAAAAAEGHASHPIAEAIRSAAAERGIAVPPRADRRSACGRGVVADTGEDRLCAGSARLLAELGAPVPDPLADALANDLERGWTPVFVARATRVLGALLFEDAVRGDAAESVARLGRLGLRTALVSGDHAGAGARAAERAGIADVASEVSPEGKVERVLAERRRGLRVLVAGDGINDAAALAAADVGVAFARGSDVTLETSDLIVTAPRLGALADAIELSRATLRVIRQGLGIAIAYNAVAVPLAAAGVLQPLAAALAMSLSSLVVTANAVRLARWTART